LISWSNVWLTNCLGDLKLKKHFFNFESPDRSFGLLNKFGQNNRNFQSPEKNDFWSPDCSFNLLKKWLLISWLFFQSPEKNDFQSPEIWPPEPHSHLLTFLFFPTPQDFLSNGIYSFKRFYFNDLIIWTQRMLTLQYN
jgi:hypothetical protein